MADKKILFISSSGGLGHVTRDLAIAKELKKQNPDVELSWLASSPAKQIIKDAGEILLPEADLWADETTLAESLAKTDEYRIPIMKWALKSMKSWAHNFDVYREVTRKGNYDLVIGDETYGINRGLRTNPHLKKGFYVYIIDYIGLVSIRKNLLEKLAVYYFNWESWTDGMRRYGKKIWDLFLYVGQQEDIQDRKFGFLMPNMREWTLPTYKSIGYIIPFDPSDYIDRKKIRDSLDYGNDPLIICTVGGTAVGKALLELCIKAFPHIKKKIPAVRMVLICGPRISADSLNKQKGIEVLGYVPSLHKHFAASDLAIVQAGNTTTIELTALRRPFLYFPLEEHVEQQVHVSWRQTRLKAGVKMAYSCTTPELLAEKVVENLGKEVTWAPIPVDGAQKAAHMISKLLYPI
jgi:UDP:flavonoid glycosyltransferase YjiC (YdhE family)